MLQTNWSEKCERVAIGNLAGFSVLWLIKSQYTLATVTHNFSIALKTPNENIYMYHVY